MDCGVRVCRDEQDRPASVARAVVAVWLEGERTQGNLQCLAISVVGCYNNTAVETAWRWVYDSSLQSERCTVRRSCRSRFAAMLRSNWRSVAQGEGDEERDCMKLSCSDRGEHDLVLDLLGHEPVVETPRTMGLRQPAGNALQGAATLSQPAS